MPRTTRRTLAFDAMEGRVLLSTGMAHRAVAADRAKASVSNFELTGVLRGIPFGTVGPDGINVSSFTLAGRTKSMGKVAGSLTLNDTVIAPGEKPDLGNATMTLSNMRGSVQLKMDASPSNRYIYIVSAGTGVYSSIYGSGAAVITYNQRLHEYQVVLHSSAP
jgi:hypothetical protein